jgi:glutamate synthase (NADPH/NADH) large chain
MVDLDPLDASDASILQEMLTAHHAKTGSAVAKFILADLDNQIKKFIKVFPRDYKKALATNKAAMFNQ